MKFKISLSILVFSLSFQSIKAQTIEPNLKWGKPTEEELKMTVYDIDKDADALILYHQTSVNYNFVNGDFKVVYRIKSRLKVLKPEGKRVADESIMYYENETNRIRKETVVGLKATAYNLESGKVVKTKMENSMVNTERLDKNQMLLKFSVPQVKVGTVIEYEYRIESDYYGDIRDWYAQHDIPVLYTQYELSIPEWFKFNIEETGVNTLESQRNSGTMNLAFNNGENTFLSTEERTFTGRNLPAIKDDNWIWHAEDYGNKVTAELSGIYIPGEIHKSYSSTWMDVDKQLMGDEDFGGRIKTSSPLKNEIFAAGIPDIADKTERAAAVWQLLKKKVRWNKEYAIWGKSSSKVLKEGTGSNADINFLYMNMLKDAGIETTPIVLRLRNSGILPLSHSSLKYLNSFVVGIHTNDSTILMMDGSVEDGYFNVLPTRLLVEKARALVKNNDGYWVNLLESANSRIATTIQAELDAEGVLTGFKTSQLIDESAASLRRSWREAKDSTELIHKKEEHDGIKIEDYQLEGRHDFSPMVKETTTFTKQCDTAGDMIYLNPLVFSPIQESIFTDEERNLPVEFPCKGTEIINVIINIPEGYTVDESPKPIILKMEGISAKVMGTVKKGRINMLYQLNISKTFFPQSEYKDLKSFFDRLVESTKNIITIKKAG